MIRWHHSQPKLRTEPTANTNPPSRFTQPVFRTQAGKSRVYPVPAVRRFGGSAVRPFGGSAVRRFGGSAVRRFGGSAVIPPLLTGTGGAPRKSAENLEAPASRNGPVGEHGSTRFSPEDTSLDGTGDHTRHPSHQLSHATFPIVRFVRLGSPRNHAQPSSSMTSDALTLA
jgi:hypothetical protein